MKKFLFVFLAVLGLSSVAFGGNCHNNVGQLQAQGYTYVQPNAVRLEIVNPANNYYTVRPQPILEVQKVERIVVPHSVNYVAQPQRVQTVERIQVQNYGQPLNIQLDQGMNYNNSQALSLARHGRSSQRTVQVNRQGNRLRDGRIGRALRELTTPNQGVQRNVQRSTIKSNNIQGVRGY